MSKAFDPNAFDPNAPITAIEMDVAHLENAGIINSEVGEHGSTDPLTFRELRDANMTRLLEFPGHSESDDPWVASDWAVALVGEVGELLNKLKKIRRGVVYPGDTMPSRQEVEDELADAQTYLDLLAGYLQVDLGAATRSKFNRVSDRFGLKTRLLQGGLPGMKYDSGETYSDRYPVS